MNGFIDVLSPIPLKKASQEKTLTPSTDEPSRNALTFAMTSFLTFALSGSMQLLRRYSIARILNLKSSQVKSEAPFVMSKRTTFCLQE